MDTTICNLTKTNFHDVVSLVKETIGRADPMAYSRMEAENFVKEYQETTRVLEVNGQVMGAYSYSESPNSYGLNFFALTKLARKTKPAFKLYLDMKNRLVDRPVMATVYADNKDMVDVVARRGTYIGSSPSKNGTVVSYYSFMFTDFKKGKK